MQCSNPYSKLGPNYAFSEYPIKSNISHAFLSSAEHFHLYTSTSLVIRMILIYMTTSRNYKTQFQRKILNWFQV